MSGVDGTELEVDLGWEGRRCRVHALGAKASRAVAIRLASKVGGSMKAAALAGVRDANAAQAFGVGSLLESLDETTIEWLTDTFMKVTQVERTPGELDWSNPNGFQDLMFGGSDGLSRWFKWINACVEHSCGAFFRAALAELNPKATVKAPSASPTT